MAFTVISFAPGLSPAERERAEAGAPPFTSSPAPYPELLERAGWEISEDRDVTEGFGAIARRELAAFEARLDPLRELLGAAELAERLQLRRSKLAGIAEGLIRRALLVARPGTRAI